MSAVVEDLRDVGEQLPRGAAQRLDPLAPAHRIEVLGKVACGTPLLQVDEHRGGVDVHGCMVVDEPRPCELVRPRGRPQPLENQDRPPEPGEHHGQQENAEKDIDDGELLGQVQLEGEDRRLDQRDAEVDLTVQQGNQHQADEHVVAHEVHGHLTRPTRETG